MTAAPYIEAWREKCRMAVQFRWRQARRAGADLSRADVEHQLGLDRHRLMSDGLVAAADGCPSCGRLLDLGRVRLVVADRGEPPRYPTNLAWTSVPCPSCRRPR